MSKGYFEIFDFRREFHIDNIYWNSSQLQWPYMEMKYQTTIIIFNLETYWRQRYHIKWLHAEIYLIFHDCQNKEKQYMIMVIDNESKGDFEIHEIQQVQNCVNYNNVTYWKKIITYIPYLKWESTYVSCRCVYCIVIFVVVVLFAEEYNNTFHMHNIFSIISQMFSFGGCQTSWGSSSWHSLFNNNTAGGK